MYELERKLAESWQPSLWSDLTTVIAVSGGADSTALLRALQSITQPGPGRLIVAHFNHRLRGEASDADETFVAELARNCGLDFHVDRADACQSTADGISEQAARNDRHRFFREVAQATGARFVATAHTADDQAETILHRIVRGTGISGLAGIPRARTLVPDVAIIRPMLDVRRAEVLEYLAALDQPFRTDASNESSRFTRNRLRHELLPHLAEQYNANIVDALLRLGRLAGETQQFVEAAVATTVDDCVVARRSDRVVIDCRRLPNDPFVVRELLISLWRTQQWPLGAMSFAKWESLASLAQQSVTAAEIVATEFPGAIRAEKTGDSLTLSRP